MSAALERRLCDRKGKEPWRRAVNADFVVRTVVLIWRFQNFGSMPRSGQETWIPAYSLYTVAVMAFLLVGGSAGGQAAVGRGEQEDSLSAFPAQRAIRSTSCLAPQ